MASKKGNAPADWLELMATEEKRTGLPSGTLASLVKQETGFQQRFLEDPSAAHYAAGPNGEKPKSSARGLGGILEGTAKKPGYGVAPLKDWSVPEQLRFMADYVTARGKRAGSLEAGLAGYGEGTKYAAQVASRIPNRTPATKEQDAPAMVAQQEVAPVTQEAPVQMALAPEELPPLQYKPSMNEADLVDPNMAWNGGQLAAASQMTPAAFNFGFSNPIDPKILEKHTQPNLTAFSGWGRFRAA